MELTNLKRGTMVVHKGLLGRILEQYLNPNVKPGIGRVTYKFERAYVNPNGEVKFGVFRTIIVKASNLIVRD